MARGMKAQRRADVAAAKRLRELLQRVLFYDGIPAADVAALLQLPEPVVRNLRRAGGRCPDDGEPVGQPQRPKRSRAEIEDRDAEFGVIDALMRSNRSVCG